MDKMKHTHAHTQTHTHTYTHTHTHTHTRTYEYTPILIIRKKRIIIRPKDYLFIIFSTDPRLNHDNIDNMRAPLQQPIQTLPTNGDKRTIITTCIIYHCLFRMK